MKLDSVNFKDIYSLVLADEHKIIFIISPTKTLTSLVEDIPSVIEIESILSKMYISKDEQSGIFYEVKIYE